MERPSFVREGAARRSFFVRRAFFKTPSTISSILSPDL